MKNTAGGQGGGIYNTGTASLAYSQVIRNTANGDGGGIYSSAGTVTLTHSPVEANTPDNCVGC